MLSEGKQDLSSLLRCLGKDIFREVWHRSAVGSDYPALISLRRDNASSDVRTYTLEDILKTVKCAFSC